LQQARSGDLAPQTGAGHSRDRDRLHRTPPSDARTVTRSVGPGNQPAGAQGMSGHRLIRLPGHPGSAAVDGKTMAEALMSAEADAICGPADVKMDLLRSSTTTSHCPFKGDAVYWSVETGDGVAEDVVWSYPEPFPRPAKTL
jgi:hypothetical protein